MQFNNHTENENKKYDNLAHKEINSRSPLRLDFILITLALVSFTASSGVQAISPAPDGCYPNFTTAEDAMHLTPSAPALEILGLVGVRSFQSATAASTPVLALGRCS